MKAEILAIGSELVSGQSLDTNSQWISRALAAIGIPVRFHSTISDDMDENLQALRFSLNRADLLILTGGLGPTQDDLTREALANVAEVPLQEDPASLAAIVAMFERRNRVMAERNRVQAALPKGSFALANRVGTAPGIWMKIGKTWVAALPGVPHEMKIMFDEQVVPRLTLLGLGSGVIVQRKINLFGKGESEFEAEALDLTVRGRIPEVGITAHDATISFRVAASGANIQEAEALISPTLATIYERFGSLVIGEAADDLPEALFALLKKTNRKLALAESCTGGLVSEMLTTLPGISPYFLGGVVSYCNEAKAALLGVDRELIASHGAVSPEVAAAMAVGARERFQADHALSITGIAGPSGGTPEKPVGLVYLGLATDQGVATRRLDIGVEQPRNVIQRRAAKHALNWLRLTLLAELNSQSLPNG